MRKEGDHAPEFELYGVRDGERDLYRLHDVVARDELTLLLFYPMDFSPVCTAQLCAIRDGSWFDRIDGLNVWGISADSLYAHQAFGEQHGIDYPLLTDSGAEVAGRYGVKYDWWDAHLDVPKRAIFLVDRDGTVAYAWSHDDAYHQPPTEPLRDALDPLLERVDDVDDLPVPDPDPDPVPTRLG